MSKLVTVFGCGGFVGRFVAQELLAAGYRVRAAERNPQDAMAIKPLGNLGQTQFISADVTKPDLSVLPMVSDALGSCDPATPELISQSGNQRNWRVRVPLSEGKKFLQLRATLTP